MWVVFFAMVFLVDWLLFQFLVPWLPSIYPGSTKGFALNIKRRMPSGIFFRSMGISKLPYGSVIKDVRAQNFPNTDFVKTLTAGRE